MKTYLPAGKIKNRILISFFIIVFISADAFSQVPYNINTSGTSFVPQNITINVGDTVIWTNTGGTHNVNGSQETFPDNPESFFNEVGAGWVFTHVFTLSGHYDYQCDPHAGIGMTGTITVMEVTNISDETVNLATVYPNPTSGPLFIQLSDSRGENITVILYDITGAQLDKQSFTSTSEVIGYNLSERQNGVYFIKIINGNEREVFHVIKN
ncbi:MAG: T9SS type A sorting domain-containing protein [Bacteroidales bacterium]|nr:T9SS type A sorting domain-containing protein [Bacteroidales bacterium]